MRRVVQQMMCSFLVLLAVGLFISSLQAQPAVLKTNWAIDAEPTSFTNIPWFSPGDNGVRYCTYNPATDHVLVISRTNVPGGLLGTNADIIILDAATGTKLGKLPFDPAVIYSQDPFVLLNIKCNSEGVIFAGNLVQTAANFPFKLYRWENETAAPTLAYESLMWENRYGDALGVTGAGDQTMVYIGGSVDQVFINILTTTNGIDYDWTEMMSIPTAYASLGIAPISPNGNVWVNNGYITPYTPVALLAPDGTVIGTVPYEVADDYTSGICYFTFKSREYIMVFSGEILPQTGYLLDVTDGPESAKVIAETPEMGSNTNEMGLGDIAYDSKRNAIIVLCTNNQIASFDLSSVLETKVETECIGSVPGQIALHQNYPNPFNPQTTISFDLPHDDDIQLIVCDITGRKVADLANARYTAGQHKVSWDGCDLQGNQACSGIYLYRLVCGRSIQIKKMMLVH